MIADYYHKYNTHPIKWVIMKYSHGPLSKDTSTSEIDWVSDDDQILCCQAIEEITGISIPDNDIERFFYGDITIGEIISMCDELEKLGAITTPEQRARQRQYYMANKAKIARRARRRRQQQKSGMKIKKRRVGSAATGYTFIYDSSGSRKGSGVSRASKVRATRGEYEPTPTGSVHRNVTLKGH